MTVPVIAITGASGLVGSLLRRRLEANGAQVIALTRRPANDRHERTWGQEGANLSGVDAVVHLAGESIASGLWTHKRKQAILESRVLGTKAIANSCRLHGVGHLVCASAVGFYGDRGDGLLDECSEPGTGFLAEVCKAWELAASGPGTLKVAHLRFGQILSWDGGALAVQARLYRWGLGARLGSGQQWMPWVGLDDATRAIEHALNHQLGGAINVVTPSPIRQEEFHHAMCNRLHRPRFPTAPEAVLTRLPGGFGKELLLASTRVLPNRLKESGFVWNRPVLGDALK